MKKLFLTSGVILCMACPAMAANDITTGGKDATNTSVTANCTATYLNSYTGPVNFKAKWTANTIGVTYTCGTAPTVSGLSAAYTFKSSPNENTPPSATTATYDSAFTLASTPGTCMPSSTTAGKGFHFNGWTCTPSPTNGESGGSSYPASYNSQHSAWEITSPTINPFKAASAVTCAAQWYGNTYTITYAKNTKDINNNTLVAADGTTATPSGTTGTNNQKSVTYNSNVTLDANGFSLANYTWSGWTGDYNNTTGAAGSTAYGNSDQLNPYRIANNLTLKAKWTPNCNGAITLDANKYNATTNTQTDYAVTTPSPNSIYVKFNTGAYTASGCGTTATLAKPSLTGYTFGGYYTSKNGGGTQMTNSTPALTDAGKRANASGTWYAKWTPVTVSNGLVYSCGTAPTVASTQLTFSTSNGGNTPPSSVNTTYDSSYTLASTTTCALSGDGAAGYHWGGWRCVNDPETNQSNNGDGTLFASTYSNSAYSVAKTISKWKATSAVTCAAEWTGNTYSITYARNTKDVNNNNLVTQAGATLTPSGTITSQDVTYNTKHQVRTGLTASCYTFGGWVGSKKYTTVSGSGTETYSSGGYIDKYIYPGNATLTAKWTPNTSGSISLVNSVYPSNNRSQSATYTTSHATEPVTAQTTTTVHTTFNTGIYSGATGTTAIVAANMKPTKAGYTFGGFYDEAGTTQYITAAGAATDAGKRAICTSGGTSTWYANWSKTKYNVTYQAGTHGTGSNYTHSNGAEYDSAYTTRTLGQTGIVANEGYSFAGWKGSKIDGSSASATYNAGTNIGTWKIAGTNTFTAQWTAIAQNVTWSCGSYGGSNINGAVNGATTWTYDSSFSVPSTPGTCNTLTSGKINGIHFAGYKCSYDPATGSGSNVSVGTLSCGTCTNSTANTCTVSGSGTFKGTSAITCTAQWEPNTVCPISWSGNGGSTPSGGSTSCTYNSTLTIPTTAPTRTGYTFNGWTLN